jgi:hypothetical protein
MEGAQNMSDAQLHEVSHQTPAVDADGMVGRRADDNWGRRAVLAESLAATTGAPLPQRLLLDHSVQTRQDQMRDAKVEAYFQAFLALVVALPVMGILSKQLGQNSVTFTTGAAMVLLAGVRAYWAKMSAPGKIWERTEWLDFEQRTWRRRKHCADDFFPRRNESVPFDALALLCFEQSWEQGVSYDVGLCKLADLQTGGMSAPPRLNHLRMFDLEDEAHDVARAVAARWGIACWQHVGGSAPALNRLC